jgi:UDP-glucose 6-dehydrogenase
MKVGIINKSTNTFFLEKISNQIFFTDEDETQVIKICDVIFYVEDTKILPNNTFDTKGLNNTIESWGFCFENEISVQGKTFVISSNLNIGETNRINEILNPMNIDVVYFPPTSKIHLGQIILGTLNQTVISDLTNLFLELGIKNLSVTSMSAKSAETLNLLDNNYQYIKHTFSKLIEEISEDTDEIKLMEKFLGLDSVNETLEMKLKNDVLSWYINANGTPINTADEVSSNLDNHNIFILNNILDNNQDKNIPIIVDGITYSDSDIVNSRKVFVILELLKRGYTVNVLEEESFLKNKKIIQEISHDFTDKVKFFKKGLNLVGEIISL